MFAKIPFLPHSLFQFNPESKNGDKLFGVFNIEKRCLFSRGRQRCLFQQKKNKIIYKQKCTGQSYFALFAQKLQ